jgi:hypothetical protein
VVLGNHPGLLRGGGFYGGAAAGELEAQQPYPWASIVCLDELPFFGGVACEVREIAARACVFHELTDDLAVGVDEDAHRDFDVTANSGADGVGDVWAFLVDDARRLRCQREWGLCRGAICGGRESLSGC